MVHSHVYTTLTLVQRKFVVKYIPRLRLRIYLTTSVSDSIYCEYTWKLWYNVCNRYRVVGSALWIIKPATLRA